MFSGINFIKDRQKFLVKEREKDKKALLFSSILFGVIICLFFITIGLNFWVVRQVKQLKTTQAQLDRLIAENQAVELEYAVLVDKLKIISLLFGSRKQKQEALNYFSNLFDKEVVVSGIKYAESEGQESLSFSLKVPSVFHLEKVLDHLDSDEVNRRFNQVKKHGLSRNSEGNYTVKVAVVLGSKNQAN